MSKKINLSKAHKIAIANKLTPKQTGLMLERLKHPDLSGYKIALRAGYTPNVANQNPIASYPKVQQSIAQYIRDGNYDSKIQRHYDEALALSADDHPELEDKLAIIKTKQAVVKQLHKIAGHEAPVKRDIRTISFQVPNFDEDSE